MLCLSLCDHTKKTRTKLTTAGDRCFQSAGPKLWNRLPTEIRNSHTLNQFKTKLKTHLFCCEYNKLLYCFNFMMYK